MKKMSKEMKLVYSRKSKRRLVNCIRVSNSEQEKEMIAGARSDKKKKLYFTLQNGRPMKNFYSKEVKSSDSCLGAITLAVVYDI